MKISFISFLSLWYVCAQVTQYIIIKPVQEAFLHDHVGKKPKSTSQQKLARHLDIVKPKQKSSDPAPLKLDYRSIVSMVTLNPRCKIFVLSTDVIKWSYHLKIKSKRRPFERFLLWQIHFLDSVDKIKPFFVSQSGPTNESKTVRIHSLKLPRSVGLSVAWCLVRMQSHWLNLNSI